MDFEQQLKEYLITNSTDDVCDYVYGFYCLVRRCPTKKYTDGKESIHYAVTTENFMIIASKDTSIILYKNKLCIMCAYMRNISYCEFNITMMDFLKEKFNNNFADFANYVLTPGMTRNTDLSIDWLFASEPCKSARK